MADTYAHVGNVTFGLFRKHMSTEIFAPTQKCFEIFHGNKPTVLVMCRKSPPTCCWFEFGSFFASYCILYKYGTAYCDICCAAGLRRALDFLYQQILDQLKSIPMGVFLFLKLFHEVIFLYFA